VSPVGAETVVWFTGKPSSGKSTLARSVHQALLSRGAPVCLLDGDEVRAVLRPEPGYDPAGRDAFYATLAGLAALLASQGMIVLVAATAHARAFRERARSLATRYLEVYVDVSDEELRRRDSKGLYRAADAGRAAGVPGVDLAYEVAESPDVTALGGRDPAALAKVLCALGFP
jgi:adenylylsulfate kinase